MPKGILRHIILLCCCFNAVTAQQSVQDSLKNEISSLVSEAGFNPQDSLYIHLLNELGSTLRFYKADSLLLLTKEAYIHSKKADHKHGEIRALLGFGNYYSDKGKSAKAIKYYNKGLSLAKETNKTKLILKLSNNLCVEYAETGDYAKALNGYLEALEIAAVINDQLMLSIINENIAHLYASQKDYSSALVFYEKVKKINDGIGNEIYSAETMSNLASVYADIDSLNYAMFNINKSIAIFEKAKIMDWLAFAYEIKGKTYLKQNKFQWALYWYKQSKLVHENLDDDRGKINLFNGMAEAYLGLENDSISEAFALDALALAKRIRFTEAVEKSAKTLYAVNKRNENFAAALNYHEMYQRIYDTISRNESINVLSMLNAKMEYDEQKLALIRKNEKALAKQRTYIYYALTIILIAIIIIVLVRRGTTIQKRLNRELQEKKAILEGQEVELRDSNETKTKLFSIIGHDLRGPIGALQSLLKLFSDGEIGKKEFIELIPKLRIDVDTISFTLNNLLSWGQTQMNGSTTKPAVVALETLVSENIKLLSEMAKNKSIKIVNNLPANTLTWVDANQIDIVVRNLISNALKFTPMSGLITINAFEKNSHWEVLVRDTGVGMDKITLNKLFKTNTSESTYGTNDEKGTGLGLSLCKEMIEKNSGTIWAESALRKGSYFYFTLPKARKSYSKTA